MIIEVQVGMAECMYEHNTTEELNVILKKHLADKIYETLLKTDYIKIQSRFVNLKDGKEGAEYKAYFVLLNEEDSNKYIKQMKQFKNK